MRLLTERIAEANVWPREVRRTEDRVVKAPPPTYHLNLPALTCKEDYKGRKGAHHTKFV